MKQVTYADSVLFFDDDAADWLMEYARALGSAGLTDTVTLRGLGADGAETDVTLLLNPSTELIAQTTTDPGMSGPANDAVVGYMQERTRLIVAPPTARLAEDASDLP